MGRYSHIARASCGGQCQVEITQTAQTAQRKYMAKLVSDI